MASIPPSTWLLPPSRTNAPEKLLFPHKTCNSLRPILASPREAEPSLPEDEASDPIKLAFAKAEAYKKSNASSPVPRRNPVLDPGSGAEGSGVSAPEVPDAVRLAMERAREYKKNNGTTPTPIPTGGSRSGSVRLEVPKNSGKMENATSLREGLVENKISKKEEVKVSSIDFLGLDFSEKKNYRGKPPGLAPVVDPIFEGDLPEVEIIVGDASKFEAKTSQKIDSNDDDDSIDLYKPKVSTWGVFPRPKNISKTFGGGRVIRPGEVLETEEDKAAKEKHTRELIAAYRKKMGLTVDAKTKAECEKTLKEGDNLMDIGKLREALPYYEKVMKDMVFQSELHGLAALQWSICQDSLRRSNEARVMYEKLQSHPNVQVRKKAKQFAFSFQAMEMMKVSSSSFSRTTGYENYFEAFVEKKSNYTRTEEEENDDVLRLGLPYIMFLVSPIFIVILIAVKKSFQF